MVDIKVRYSDTCDYMVDKVDLSKMLSQGDINQGWISIYL